MTLSRCRSIVILTSLLVLASLLAAVGCAGRPSLIPNSDPALRKTSAQFAADAAKRHPFKTDAPSAGQAVARAEVDYMLNEIDVANLSQEDWEEVELWVNRSYVVHLPHMTHGKQVSIPFQMLYDDKGNYIPTSKLALKVCKLEAYMGGKMYEIPVRLAD